MALPSKQAWVGAWGLLLQLTVAMRVACSLPLAAADVPKQAAEANTRSSLSGGRPMPCGAPWMDMPSSRYLKWAPAFLNLSDAERQSDVGVNKQGVGQQEVETAKLREASQDRRLPLRTKKGGIAASVLSELQMIIGKHATSRLLEGCQAREGSCKVACQLHVVNCKVKRTVQKGQKWVQNSMCKTACRNWAVSFMH